MVEYSFDKSTVLEFEPLAQTDLVSILIGVDRDYNLSYDRHIEPKEIITLNVKNRTVNELVSSVMKKNIQLKID